MKLHILDTNTANLEVYYGNKDYRTISNIPTDSLLDWYPLSNSYIYKLSKDMERLELKRLRTTLPVSYGVERNQGSCSCQVGVWSNPIVKGENLKIIDKAKQYGLPVMTEPYDLSIVQKGFQDLGVIFNNLKNIIITRYLDGKTDEELKSFKLKKEETQLNEALRNSDSMVDLTYNDLGQMYNMLLLMKKICSKDG